jgi:hypothetical protein
MRRAPWSKASRCTTCTRPIPISTSTPAREQAHCWPQAGSLLVFLHPIQWYSMPALLKEWIDVVLQPGWAFGEPDSTRCKRQSATGWWPPPAAASDSVSRRCASQHGRPFADFLAPFEQTAALVRHGLAWRRWCCMARHHVRPGAAVDAHVAANSARAPAA